MKHLKKIKGVNMDRRLYRSTVSYDGLHMYFTEQTLREVDCHEIFLTKKNLVNAILEEQHEPDYTKSDLMKKTKQELIDIVDYVTSIF
jgi:hypothetical protein